MHSLKKIERTSQTVKRKINRTVVFKEAARFSVARDSSAQNSSVLDPLIYHYSKQLSVGNNDLSLFSKHCF